MITYTKFRECSGPVSPLYDPERGRVETTVERISRRDAMLGVGVESLGRDDEGEPVKWVFVRFERSGCWPFRQYWRITETVALPCPVVCDRNETRQLVPSRHAHPNAQRYSSLMSWLILPLKSEEKALIAATLLGYVAGIADSKQDNPWPWVHAECWAWLTGLQQGRRHRLK